MLIYKHTKSFERNGIAEREYLGKSLDDVRNEFSENRTPSPVSIHSWFVDDFQEEIVRLASTGNWERIKEKIAETGKGPEYLAQVRFCNDGFSTVKYADNDQGPFDGYSLLNIAFFCGDKEAVKYLINECGMNPNDKCYANAIWTAALPTNIEHTKPDSTMLPLLKGRFQMLEELIEGEEIRVPIELSGHLSGKVKDTVFHIAGHVVDHDLRGEMLGFFAHKVPEDAARRSEFGIAKNLSAEEKAAKSKTPIFNICKKVAGRFKEEAGLRVKLNSYFDRDLRTLVGCGGFEDYKSNREYAACLELLPETLKRTFDGVFNQSRAMSSSSASSPNAVTLVEKSKSEAKGGGAKDGDGHGFS